MNREKKQKSLFSYWKKCSIFSKFNWVVLLISLFIVVYLIIGDRGNISNIPYGAGDYYYTDLEGFEKIFFPEGTSKIGTKHPIIFISLFLGWGGFCWYFLKWIENKKL